jgi:hypothetical protein
VQPRKPFWPGADGSGASVAEVGAEKGRKTRPQATRTKREKKRQRVQGCPRLAHTSRTLHTQLPLRTASLLYRGHTGWGCRAPPGCTGGLPSRRLSQPTLLDPPARPLHERQRGAVASPDVAAAPTRTTAPIAPGPLEPALAARRRQPAQLPLWSVDTAALLPVVATTVPLGSSCCCAL